MEVISRLKEDLLNQRENKVKPKHQLDREEKWIDLAELCLRRFETHKNEGSVAQVTDLLEKLLDEG